MGALVDGFEAAQKEHDERIAEQRRREAAVDAALAEVTRLLEEDTAFLSQHGITHDTSHRILHINYHREPIIAVHFESGQNQFRVIYMRDNTTQSPESAEDCARLIGGLLFGVITRE